MTNGVYLPPRRLLISQLVRISFCCPALIFFPQSFSGQLSQDVFRLGKKLIPPLFGFDLVKKRPGKNVLLQSREL